MGSLTLRKLKEVLNKIPDSELDRPLIYNSEEYLLNGEVESIERVEETKYLTEDGDIFTMQELLEEEYYEPGDEELIKAECAEIPKGSYYITF